jgi:hypothetical protein
MGARGVCREVEKGAWGGGQLQLHEVRHRQAVAGQREHADLTHIYVLRDTHDRCACRIACLPAQ